MERRHCAGGCEPSRSSTTDVAPVPGSGADIEARLAAALAEAEAQRVAAAWSER
eukprot:SAG31_NODE_23209_length_509_cov_0.629268_1_plen_54_part_00